MTSKQLYVMERADGAIKVGLSVDPGIILQPAARSMTAPDAETVLVTSELIELGRSETRGWNKAQIELLGLDWPPRPSWRTDVIGITLSKEAADGFIAMKPTSNAPSRERVAPRKRRSVKRSA